MKSFLIFVILSAYLTYQVRPFADGSKPIDVFLFSLFVMLITRWVILWFWRWFNEPQPGHDRHSLPLEYLDGKETKHSYILRFRGEPSRENLGRLSPMPRDRVLSTDEGFEVIVNKRNQGGQSRARLLDDYERFATRRTQNEPHDSKDWDM